LGEPHHGADRDAALDPANPRNVHSYNHGKPVAIEGRLFIRSRLHRRQRFVNLLYGIAKGTDPASLAVWGAVRVSRRVSPSLCHGRH